MWTKSKSNISNFARAFKSEQQQRKNVEYCGRTSLGFNRVVMLHAHCAAEILFRRTYSAEEMCWNAYFSSQEWPTHKHYCVSRLKETVVMRSKASSLGSYDWAHHEPQRCLISSSWADRKHCISSLMKPYESAAVTINLSGTRTIGVSGKKYLQKEEEAHSTPPSLPLKFKRAAHVWNKTHRHSQKCTEMCH